MNQRKQSWFSFCILVSSSLQDVLGDVIVETVHNFKPISIYEDEPARYKHLKERTIFIYQNLSVIYLFHENIFVCLRHYQVL